MSPTLHIAAGNASYLNRLKTDALILRDSALLERIQVLETLSVTLKSDFSGQAFVFFFIAASVERQKEGIYMKCSERS